MTVINTVTLPVTLEGNDSNDQRNDTEFMQKILTEPTGLDSFVLNGESKNMKAQMLEDKYILGKLAILGQSTAIYAKPNAGKTLLVIWLLIESIKAGNINPDDALPGQDYH